MAADALAQAISHAAALERRDAAIAAELAVVVELAGRVETLRGRAAIVGAALARAPAELGEADNRRRAAEVDETAARAERGRAEAAVAHLERSRRRRPDELARARRELQTAREALADAEAQTQRLVELVAVLEARPEALAVEVAVLVRGAAELAGELRGVARLSDGMRREPAASLVGLEEWGGRVRSALFVARGALETERERIVVEANALGSAVLGEQLGASSVAVVRRRIERELG